jgi:hypothetical protein
MQKANLSQVCSRFFNGVLYGVELEQIPVEFTYNLRA